MPVQQGCTSTRPTYDEHHRLVGFHQEFDTDKTLRLLQLLASTASTAYGIPAAMNGSDSAKLLQLAKFGNTLSSLSKQNQNSPVAHINFEPIPYGYEELGNRVTEAIENPKLFIRYLGLDTSREMPEEVKRLRQYEGEWEYEVSARLTNGQKTKGKATGQNKFIEDGWLLLIEPSNEQNVDPSPNQIILRTIGLTGWSPKDNLYHTLQITKRYAKSLESPIVSFCEITHSYDPPSNTWTAKSKKITGDNAYIVGTIKTIFEGDRVTSDGTFNFGTTKIVGKRLSRN